MYGCTAEPSRGCARREEDALLWGSVGLMMHLRCFSLLEGNLRCAAFTAKPTTVNDARGRLHSRQQHMLSTGTVTSTSRYHTTTGTISRIFYTNIFAKNVT